MFVLGIFFAFAIFAKGFLNKSKSNLNIFLLSIAITIPIIIGIFERFYVRGLIAATTNPLGAGSSLSNADDDISLINNLIELVLKNFVGFDDWIYISIGQFGYLDHRGLNLVAAAWSGLIYLAIIFSIQRTNLWSKIGIFTIVIGATIVSPLAAYQFSGLHEGGYQVRYGMALICSIPIFTALNSVSNLFNIKEFRVIVLWLIPIAMISDWFISWYRYSHGLPFRNFTEGFEKYDSWIGWELRSILISLLILFILIIIAIFKIEKYELANQSRVSK
jgi:hypothetical protein